MYLSGFGNHHQTEAIANALPKNQNSPQHCTQGLYAEQLSGSAFTMPRSENLHSWVYRRLPSVVHADFVPYRKEGMVKNHAMQAPNPYRWSPFPPPKKGTDFIDGLLHIAGNVSNNAYLYQCNKSMSTTYFTNHDGEMLFVPYHGEIILKTELGELHIRPGQIAVIPRGIIFKVEVPSEEASGYLCENSGQPLRLPSLGLMGANALANPRHFLYPVAAFEDYLKPVTVICKSAQHLWSSEYPSSPLNVLAWHGNYAPYCYDLSLFNTINTVSFDHPDPSIFTVLTSKSDTEGIANLDFVIFPPRWMVAEHSFRPPYFHRNVMSELMGLVKGNYDAKQEGFSPGGISIHNAGIAHGPDRKTFEMMSTATLKPTHLNGTLAFMFETKEPWLVSDRAFKHSARQGDYSDCWRGF